MDLFIISSISCVSGTYESGVCLEAGYQVIVDIAPFSGSEVPLLASKSPENVFSSITGLSIVNMQYDYDEVYD